MGGEYAHLDILLWAVFPYAAVIVFLLVTIQRYRKQTFSYSSLSSQFLENKQHFWGTVPFHYGILTILTGHVVAFLFPRSILWWNGVPLRLWILEISALIFAVFTIIGLVNVITRRLDSARLRTVTTAGDWIIFGMLLVQVGTGIATAVSHPWGSSWFASTLSPYLWSLVVLSPDISYVTPLPWLPKLHIAGAFTLIAYFPFTRLVHVLVVPNQFLWRKIQVVRWNWDRRSIRRADRAVPDDAGESSS